MQFISLCRFGCLLKLLAAHDFQSLLCGKLLRFLFASAGAGSKNVGIEQQLHGEALVVVRTGLACQTVLKRFLLVGINYNKDTKEHECVIEEYRKR